MNRGAMRGMLRCGLFLLPVLMVLPQLSNFPYPVGAAFSDMAVTHYPNLLFLQRAMQSGTLPLWSPAILSGTPFAANPLSGLWYPPGWAALLFPLPLGINLALVLHIVWGGVGMYWLLRQEGLAEGPGLVGALAFEAMPKLFSHLGAGHVTLVFAVAWTPWLLYSERRWGGARLTVGVLPGVVLGLIALTDPRWAAYAGLVWLVFRLRRITSTARSQKISGISRFLTWRNILDLAANGAAALLVAAPLLVPLAEYTRLAGRAALSATDSLTLSLPPGQLFGLVYPYIAGMAEWVLYPGAGVAALVIYTISVPSLRRASRFWLWMALISGIVALGSNVPLISLIWQAPGLNLLRVPARALFLTGLSLTAVAGFAVQHLMVSPATESGSQSASTRNGRSKRDAVGLVLFAWAAFIALFGAAGWLAVPDALARIRFGWGVVFFTVSAALILLAHAHKIRGSMTFTALTVLCLVDLCGVNGLSLDFRPAAMPEALRKNAVSMIAAPNTANPYLAAAYLGAQGGGESFRVYSPSYSIPQHIGADYGLELADGVDPLRLAAYDRFMEPASGVPFRGYSVTLPPFASGRPMVDNRDYSPNASLLALLNVKYVVAEYPLRSEGLELLEQFGSTRIYHNTLALPRAWVQPAGTPVGTRVRPVERIERTPNKIIVTAHGPGLLVLAEVAYPGWTATVDGRPEPVQTAADLLRSVPLSDGEHQVVFAFRPLSVYLGLALAALGWAVFAALALIGHGRQTRGQR